MSKTEKKICVSSSTAELHRIREFIESIASQFGFKEQDIYNVILAVDEACSNLIRHGYKHDDSKQLCVTISWDDETGKLSVEVSDEAATFDPRQIPSPNMEEYFAKPRRGGLGIHIIRTLMDSVEYIPAETPLQKNILRMAKVLRSVIS
jgi:serine/threonine-protein kinase RsbW